MFNTLYNRIIFVLSIIGIIIAVYVFQSFIRQAPIVCVNSGCELVRKNPASYLFGIPVPAFGLVGYTLLAILSFFQTLHLQPTTHITTIMLCIAACGVLFVSWFTYTELFVIKAICTWCAISGVNMLTIFVFTLISYKNSQTTRQEKK